MPDVSEKRNVLNRILKKQKGTLRMRLRLTILLVFILPGAIFSGCAKNVAIIDGGHFHRNGADVAPKDAPCYSVDGPVYVIPQETFDALMRL